MNSKREKEERDELRQKAERRTAVGQEDSSTDDMTEQGLRHELQVHQIELAMQAEELELAKQRTRDADKRYAELYDMAPVGFCTLSREGVVLQANQTLCSFLEVDRARFVDRRLILFVAEDYRRGFADFLDTVFASKTHQESEAILETATGERRRVHVVGSSDERARQCRLVVVSRERHRAKRTSDEGGARDIKTLAGGMAHEFNNLLTGVLGNAELASMDLPEGSRARARLERIREAAERMTDQTSKLLAYSGQGSYHVQRVTLSEVVEEAVQTAREKIPSNVSLDVKIEPSVPAIEADVTQFHLVISNLIANGVEALGGKDGVLEIRAGRTVVGEDDEPPLIGTTPPGRYVFVEAQDSGCGMDKETLEKAFEPFFTTKFTGRGLGLAAVMGIVLSHGGAVRVHSVPGDGSLFTVLIPVEEQPKPRRAEAEPWVGRGTVLFADDEESVRDVGGAMLEHAGFEVLTAADGLEAVEVVKEQKDRLAFVILDVTMPRLDGIGALEEIGKIREDLPVFLSSGYNEHDIESRISGRQAAGFIHKPYRYEQLINQLRAVL